MAITGKLSLDGRIIIEFKEDSWRLLMSHVLSKVEHSVLVNRTEQVKARFGIVIEKAFNSNFIKSQNSIGKSIAINMSEKESDGIGRIYASVINDFCKNAWYLFGYVDNTVKKPICVVYFIEIKMAFYAIMKEGDDPKSFDPQLN